jgi:phospholipase C
VPADQKTGDLVHRWYQEQYQIDGGKMDKFVTVSDAKGLSIGYYPTEQLPVAKEAANYVLQDNFFHAAFGGSFLNHQWLVCACTPVYKDAVKDGNPGDLHTVLGANGLPTKDGQLTTQATGDYAVNTIFPAQAPTIKGAPQLPLLTNATIGDRLSAAGVSWNWYSGGWNDAVAGKADPLFQYHHQAFNYYANYATGTPGREHLQDETNFIAAAKAGTLPAVSFVMPSDADSQHSITGVSPKLFSRSKVSAGSSLSSSWRYSSRYRAAVTERNQGPGSSARRRLKPVRPRGMPRLMPTATAPKGSSANQDAVMICISKI